MAKSGRYPWNEESAWEKIRPTVTVILTTVSAYLWFSSGWDKGRHHMAEKICDDYYSNMESEDQGNSEK